jgi:hypothetical protein
LEDLSSDSDASSGSEDEDNLEGLEYIAHRLDRGEDASSLPGVRMLRLMEIPNDKEVKFPAKVEEDGSDYDDSQAEEDKDELLPEIEPAADKGTGYLVVSKLLS